MMESCIFKALVFAVSILNPSLGGEEAEKHVDAAINAANETHYSADLILAIAFVESSYAPTSLSYKHCPEEGECERRGTRTNTLPDDGNPPWYCGVMQVGGDVPWQKCRHLMFDIEANYMKGAVWLKRWEREWGSQNHHCGSYDTGSTERLKCALRGYNGGYPSINREAKQYPKRVFDTQERINNGVFLYRSKQIIVALYERIPSRTLSAFN